MSGKTAFGQAPTGLAVSGGTSQLTLTWTNVAGYTYNIYRWSSGTEPTTPMFTGKTSPYVDPGLTNGTQYIYRITSMNSSSVESAKSVSVVAVPVAQPTVSVSGGNAAITLSWGTCLGALRYNIYRSTSAGTETLYKTDISSLSFTDAGLTNGTSYFYKVSGVRRDDVAYTATESDLSTEVSAAPLATLPASPMGLAAVAGNAKVTLGWSGVPGATGYNVYRALNVSGGPYTKITATAVTSVDYIDSTVTNSTTASPKTYYYVVKTVNASGEGGCSNEAAANPALTSAAGVVLAPIADTTAVSTRATLVYGYHSPVYSQTNGTTNSIAYFKFDLSNIGGTIASAKLRLYGGGVAAGETAYGIADTSWTEAGLTWNTRPNIGGAVSASVPTTTGSTWYEWDVTSYLQSSQATGALQVSLALVMDETNASTNVFLSRESTSSQPQLALVVTPPPAPTSLTASPGNNVVNLNWTGGNSPFIVKRGTTHNGPYTTIASSVAAPYYSDTTAVNGTTYYYVVQGTIGNAESDYSNEVSATPSSLSYGGSVHAAGNVWLTDIYYPNVLQLDCTPAPVTPGYLTLVYNWARSGSGGPASYATSTNTLTDTTGFTLGAATTYTVTATATYSYNLYDNCAGTNRYYNFLRAETIPLGSVTFTPGSTTVTDNQTVDSRLDPRYSTTHYLNHNFGSTIYKGGLYAGFASDPSRVGRSYFRFQTPTATTGAVNWMIGGLHVFFEGALNNASGWSLACSPVLDNGWTPASLTWTTAPPPGSSPASVTPAITYNTTTPTTYWVHSLLPMVAICQANPSALSLCLQEANEAATNTWMYFAKKEFDAAHPPTLLYAYHVQTPTFTVTAAMSGPNQATVTVTFATAAPVGGYVVSLQGYGATCPATLTVPQGATSAQVTATVPSTGYSTTNPPDNPPVAVPACLNPTRKIGVTATYTTVTVASVFTTN